MLASQFNLACFGNARIVFYPKPHLARAFEEMDAHPRIALPLRHSWEKYSSCGPITKNEELLIELSPPLART
jgi:hypothetical protein